MALVAVASAMPYNTWRQCWRLKSRLNDLIVLDHQACLRRLQNAEPRYLIPAQAGFVAKGHQGWCARRSLGVCVKQTQRQRPEGRGFNRQPNTRTYTVQDDNWRKQAKERSA